MSNKTYDTLKLIALIFAPIATFMAALTEIWGIPYGAAITATISAVGVLMGSIVTIAKKVYDKDQLATSTPEETPEQEEG